AFHSLSSRVSTRMCGSLAATIFLYASISISLTRDFASFTRFRNPGLWAISQSPQALPYWAKIQNEPLHRTLACEFRDSTAGFCRTPVPVDVYCFRVAVDQPSQPRTIGHPRFHLLFGFLDAVAGRQDFYHKLRTERQKFLALLPGKTLQSFIGDPRRIRGKRRTIRQYKFAARIEHVPAPISLSPDA